MTPQGKKRLIIGTAILVICGVVGYFIYKKIKDSKPEEQPPAPAPDSSSGGSSNTYTGSNVSSGSQFTFPFKTTDEGNTFRAWVIAKDPQFAKSIDLSPKGPLNNYLQKAWDKYGAEYQKGSSTTTTTDATAILDEVQKNLGQGGVVERYLDKVIGRTQTIDNNTKANVYIGGVFYIQKLPSGKIALGYQVVGPGGSSKLGSWSNGGKTITMKNGRVLSNDNVWTNIQSSWNAY